jgi:hypothetical protein
MPKRWVRRMKLTSSARRCAGTEVKEARDEGEDRLDRRRRQGDTAGRRREKVDRGGAVMSQRKADLAIVVG